MNLVIENVYTAKIGIKHDIQYEDKQFVVLIKLKIR